jgi:hypothetical protein
MRSDRTSAYLARLLRALTFTLLRRWSTDRCSPIKASDQPARLHSRRSQSASMSPAPQSQGPWPSSSTSVLFAQPHMTKLNTTARMRSLGRPTAPKAAAQKVGSASTQSPAPLSQERNVVTVPGKERRMSHDRTLHLYTINKYIRTPLEQSWQKRPKNPSKLAAGVQSLNPRFDPKSARFRHTFAKTASLRSPVANRSDRVDTSIPPNSSWIQPLT